MWVVGFGVNNLVGMVNVIGWVIFIVGLNLLNVNFIIWSVNFILIRRIMVVFFVKVIVRKFIGRKRWILKDSLVVGLRILSMKLWIMRKCIGIIWVGINISK